MNSRRLSDDYLRQMYIFLQIIHIFCIKLTVSSSYVLFLLDIPTKGEQELKGVFKNYW